MPFPPSDKTMEGVLKDTRERLDLVERRLARAGTGGGGDAGEPATIHPTGDVWQVPDGVAPTDTLLADGRAVSRTTYAELFAKIGTKYGSGDGATTFNVPNLNGKRLVVTTPQSTISLDNVFASLPSIYPDSYEIRMNIHMQNFVNMRMRAAGADKTDASYDFVRWSSVGAAATVSGGQTTAATSFFLIPGNPVGFMQINMTVQRAGSTDRTEVLWTSQQRADTSTPYALLHGRGTYFPGSIVDGFTLITDSGTMYGSIDVIPFGGSTVPSVIATKPITSGVVGTGTTDGGGGTSAPAAGSMQEFAGSVLPLGALWCDGSVYSPAAYPALFAAIGTTYGGTAAAPLLPDMRGRFAVGRDPSQTEFDVLGEKGGSKMFDRLGLPLSVVEYSGGSTYFAPIQSGNSAQYRARSHATPAEVQSPSLPPYLVTNVIIWTGGASNPVTPVVPVLLWQEFALAKPGGLRPLNTNLVVWDGVISGNLGATMDATKRLITLPSTGTYRIITHLGLAANPGTGTSVSTYLNNVQQPGSLDYGNTGSAGVYVSTAEIVITATNTGPLVIEATAPLGVYDWTWMRIEKLEPFYAKDALTIQQGSTALRDSIYPIPTDAATQASLANRMISWFNTDKGYFEIYYATTGTAGLTAKGLAAGFPAGWYPAAGANIWGTCAMLSSQSVAAGEVRINLNTGDLVGGFTTGNNVMIVPVGGIYETNAHLYIWSPTGSYRGVQAFNVADGTVYCSGTTNANWDIAATPRRARIPALAQVGLRTSGDAAQTIQGQNWPAIEMKYMGPPLVNG
jgi:microcystin-dependent protein